jgi:asparagine synthase (glutamine-hydrolysing)
MCGICGRFNFRRPASIDPSVIRAMTGTIAHRGPDDEGFYISGSVGLGFRRLSIIDLKSGRQPMSDPEQTVWVVFNGEIYNFKEVRSELESLGYHFRTSSDTEVIVHGYKRWGVDVLQRLNGMFGLAIWDVERRSLMLARDRLGIKLVYYSLEEGTLSFGSEIRPILRGTGRKPEIDPGALSLFLQHRYTPSPFTIYKGIQKLAAGTRLIVEEGSDPRVERWWNFTPVPLDPMPSTDEVRATLLDLYLKAVRRQLMSDVPLGLLLSGGMDSALLLGLMRRCGESRNTYTVGYGDSYLDDELHDAARTARYFDSPNEPIQIDRETFENTLSKITTSLEEPVATSSIIPMYHLCERTRREVKVALIGQGPDELFGGYPRHLGVAYGAHWRSLPAGLRRLSGLSLARLRRNESIRRGLYSLDAPERMERYRRVLSLVPDEFVVALFRDPLPSNGDLPSIRACWQDLEQLMQQTDELGGLQFLEVRSSLPDELLMYADKLSMAHGLEIRVPYLDHELVEYVERLPASFKVRHGVGKWIHRQVAYSFLPSEILRRRKRGFASTVVDQWFRSSLSGRMNEIFCDPQSLIYRHLRQTEVEKIFQSHRGGRADYHKMLFSLVVVEELLRNCQ